MELKDSSQQTCFYKICDQKPLYHCGTKDPKNRHSDRAIPFIYPWIGNLDKKACTMMIGDQATNNETCDHFSLIFCSGQLLVTLNFPKIVH